MNTAVEHSQAPKRFTLSPWRVFLKYLRGDYGLAITTWIFGAGFALAAEWLNFVAEKGPWHWLLFSGICVVQAFTIPFAVTFAALKYKGPKIWAISAPILLLLQVTHGL